MMKADNNTPHTLGTSKHILEPPQINICKANAHKLNRYIVKPAEGLTSKLTTRQIEAKDLESH